MHTKTIKNKDKGWKMRKNYGLKSLVLNWAHPPSSASVCMYINLAQNTCEGGLCCDYDYGVFSVCGRDDYGLLCCYQNVCTVKFSLIAHTVHKNKGKTKWLKFQGNCWLAPWKLQEWQSNQKAGLMFMWSPSADFKHISLKWNYEK